MLLQAKSIAHAIGDRALFQGLDLAINAKARLGLVGHNGSGKSTLLGLLSGRILLEQGELIRQRGLVVAEVEQFLPAELQSLDLVTLVEQQGVASWEAEAALAKLGFTEAQLLLKAEDLSGGQHNRLLFARALVIEPDLLLLDEPTNHLDLATLHVIEDVLADFSGAYLVVSHDREFLDQVTNQTLYLRDQRIYSFSAPYSQAKRLLEANDDAAALARQAEEKQINSLRASAKRLKIWGREHDSEKLTRRAQSMEKRVARLEESTTFVTAKSKLKVEVDLGESRAKQALKLHQHTVAVPDKPLFFVEQELVLRPGERVALLGHNGVGKTTLIKQIVAAYRAQAGAATGDSLVLNPQTKLGYYDQALMEVAGEQSLLAFVTRRAECSDDLARGRLIHAGFAHAVHGTPIGNMSGGERARALFVVLSLQNPNFLILDEPTNHIDIQGKEQLEEQLTDSGATLLITSHDRRFLETVAQRYLWIRDGGLLEISQPQEFFATRPDVNHEPVVARRVNDAQKPTIERAEDAETELLLALDILEKKLADDLARKPKFQKPQLQQGWRDEIAQLMAQLDQL